MKKEIDILTVLKWIFLAVVILALAWYAFGHSPTLEQVFTLVMTSLFFYLALESRSGTFEIISRLEKLDMIQNTLTEIKDILKGIKVLR